MAKKYHISIRFLHWTIALIIATLICVGFYMKGLPGTDPNKFKIYGLHKSFGVTVLLLAIMRIISRFSTNIPAIPSGIPNIEKILAHVVHFSLYILILGLPLSGYAMSNFGGHGVALFGLPLPKIFPTDKAYGQFFASVHQILAYTILFLLTLHIAGVVKHRYFDKKANDVLPRMM